jgi:hypothetical protein
MAFATKYQYAFKNFFGSTTTIRIQQDGFSGSITYLTPGTTPLIVHYPGKEGEPIVGSSARMQVKYESFLDELFTEAEQTLRVYISGAFGTWYGFVTPYQNYRSMKGAPQFLTFLATDQLGLLKDINFEDSNGDPVYYIQNDFSILKAILFHTGIDDVLTKKDQINLYDANFNSTQNDSPLGQTYFYPEMYWDDVKDERGKCYDVLKDILMKYNARICQSDGAWRMQRPQTLWTKHAIRTYSQVWGWSSGTTAYDRIIKGVANNATWLEDVQETLMPRVGTVEVKAISSLKKNVCKNSSFKDFTISSGNYRYWSTINPIEERDGFAEIGVGTGTPQDQISITNIVYGVDSLRIVFDLQANWQSNTSAFVNLVITVHNGALYYTSSSGWSASSGYFSVDIYNAEGGTSMTDYKTVTIDVPINDLGSIWTSPDEIFVKISKMAVSTSTTNCFLYIKNFRIECGYNSRNPGEYIYNAFNAVSVPRMIQRELKQIDADENSTNILDRRNVGIYATDDAYFLQKSTTVRDEIYEWYVKGHNASVSSRRSIQALYAMMVLEEQYVPYYILQGTLRGVYRYHQAIRDDDFVDEIGYARHFIPLDVQIDVRRAEMTGTFREIRPIYNNENIEWASETYSGVAIIDEDAIAVITSVSGTETATSQSYTAVDGEMIRIVVYLNITSGDAPNYAFDGDTGELEQGYNYLEFRCSSQGAKTFQINNTNGEYANFQCVITFYSLEGI